MHDKKVSSFLLFHVEVLTVDQFCFDHFFYICIFFFFCFAVKTKQAYCAKNNLPLCQMSLLLTGINVNNKAKVELCD